MDLPYQAEYSKTSRASCRSCKSTIEKDTLRLAVMVQSPMFDGKVPNWYHYLCFFKKQRPKTVDDIANYESLRWDDQEKIKTQIASGPAIIVPAGKGKKRDAATAAANKAALKDFVLEYSKSSRAGCRGCEQKIMKGEVRISKKDYESDVGKRYGGQDMWHHLTCFAKLRSELGYFESGDQLPGFKSLNKEDKAEILKQLPAIKQEEVPIKKPKIEDKVDNVNGVDEGKMRAQNKIIFSWHDQLKELSKKELIQLLEENNQEVPPGSERMQERLADYLTFGALEPCKQCNGGQLVFQKLGYTCTGNVTEWSRCDFVTKEPKRLPLIIPNELKEKYSFLKKYKYVKRERIIKDAKPTTTTTVKKEEEVEDAKPKVERALPPLYDMEFAIIGKAAVEKDALKKRIVKMGGKVTTKIHEKLMAVISTAEDVEKMGARITDVQNADVHVISADFLDEAHEYLNRIPELITKKSICTWGSDPHTRLPPEPSTSKSQKSKSHSMYNKSGPSKITMKVKNGGAVDPDSGLEDCAHIYQSGKDKYTAVLGLTDIQRQTNKYYKLQLLEADNGSNYWVFRSWGRIGTSIGGCKKESMTLQAAKRSFQEIYKEKTGNSWDNRDNFVKVAGLMYPIDVDYGVDEDAQKLDINTEIVSNLDKPVQELIKFIFDIDVMKKVMLEFELDTEKMPLGKLSKKQLHSAYGVLNELQKLVETQGSAALFIDASNRFYTLVPHSFGAENPPVINDLDTIKKKIEMVENLMEMEIAYSLMKTSSGSGSSIDSHYEQLKTDIQVLDKNSEEFLIIQEYVTNTHAATHSNYKLEIEEVFVVKRHGEEKRYKPFRKLHNRKLLWHGSRQTNYAGILSQGLRIAPPEAPVTGYMFGKGIYFADMVSKSANYCCTNPNNNIGLMLLCEVALGEIEELFNAKYVEKLPKGKHSVKGVGRTEPDPENVKKIHNGVEVPAGKGVQLPRSSKTSLLYNEYIVYDVAQVNIKYLLKMHFNYKY